MNSPDTANKKDLATQQLLALAVASAPNSLVFRASTMAILDINETEETIEPTEQLKACLELVYDLIREKPANSGFRQAATGLEQRLWKMEHVNRSIRRREARADGAVTS